MFLANSMNKHMWVFTWSKHFTANLKIGSETGNISVYHRPKCYPISPVCEIGANCSSHSIVIYIKQVFTLVAAHHSTIYAAEKPMIMI